MEFLHWLNRSKIVFCFLLAGIFLFMLVCNFLTPYLMDDFDYMYNFANSEPERITSIRQIIPSMKEHRVRLNGRIVAHTIVQIIQMFPKYCFNIINSAVFTLLIFLMYFLANKGNETNNILLPTIFGAIWCFEPEFGHINLWLDGSVNYLWATTICLLFLIPYLTRFFENKSIRNPVLQIFYVISGFFMGAYSENSSFAAIVLTILIVIALLIRKEKVEWYYFVAIVLACIGYIYMVSAPGTHTQHETQWNFASLGNQFVDTMKQYKKAIPLLIVFTILVIYSIAEKTNKNILILSFLFFIGSLLSNFVMIAASYYPARSTATPITFLILADIVLLAEFFKGKHRIQVLCLTTCLLVFSVFEWCIGLKDIYTCNRKVQENKSIIYRSIENGQKEVKVPIVHAETPYSALYNMQYLSQESTYAYPNDSIKWYYGLDSILGYEPKE